MGVHRVLESLRTLEDYARFGLESERAVRRIKSLRHDFGQLLGQWPLPPRLASRSLLRDVGTTVEGALEYHRSDLAHVVGAALGRLSESLRSLEEYAKMVVPGAARPLEQMRYAGYELETLLRDPRDRRSRLAALRVCVLVDCGSEFERLIELADRLVDAGMGMVQLRAKAASDRQLLAAARRLRDELSERALLVVNDRPDVALLADADGVHVGQDDLPPDAARAVVGPARLVGLSTHDKEERQAAGDADYIGFGPMFASSTKSFDRFQEVRHLREAIEAVDVPVLAIGGVAPDNVDRLAAAGCRHVAVCGSVWRAPDPVTAVKRMAELLTHPPAPSSKERMA